MIEEVRLNRLKIPLGAPYKLALGDVVHFDTILVRLVADGVAGCGEATILTGYTDETIDESWTRARAVASRLPGQSSESALASIETHLAELPFTRTAFVTAIEMSGRHPVLAVAEPARVPLLAGLNATLPGPIEAEMSRALANGYATLKIKVGFDVEQDLARLAFIQRCNSGRMRLRIDGNQGYSQADAIRFATSISPDSVELLEQPCDAADWSAAKAVAKVSNVPLMLDESIYDLEDIDRAADTGAAFVKLKLMKMGSMAGLEAGLSRIRALGMEPVLGNGVASDIGCWMEACVARRHITNAGEMNGFLRQKVSLAVQPMRVESGAIWIGPGMEPALSQAAISEVTTDQFWADKTQSGGS